MSQTSSYPTLPRRLRPKRRRVASCLSYDGAAFHGFQRQPQQRTVEGELVRSLVEAGLSGGLSFASRTDTGVHAEGQVVCFHVDATADLGALQNELKGRLPSDIRLGSLIWAPAKFHPRWSAIGKRYVYSLTWGSPQPRTWQVEGPIALEPLEIAIEELRTAPKLGGYTAAGAPPKPAPPLKSLKVEQMTDGCRLIFEGPAFGRYAIRHMVGSVIEQSFGRLEPGSCARVAGSEGPYRGFRAPADGLVLERVYYSAELDPFASGVSGSP
jgi:tRNA pseudouridine38-40 synthase